MNLCPFASYAFDKEKILYQTQLSSDHLKQLSSFWNCIESLNSDDYKTSAILIFPNGLDDFEDYLDVYDKANWLLEDTNSNEKYQLASFHPNYLFENEAPDAVSHYTNRSPYPLIHILSVNEVTQAVESHGDTESIPTNNIHMLSSMSLENLKNLTSK